MTLISHSSPPPTSMHAEAWPLSALDALSIFDELPDGVLVLDTQGRIGSANAAFLRLLGRTREDVVGRALESLVADEDVLALLGFDTLFGAANAEDHSVLFVGADGTRRPLIVCSARSSRTSRVFLIARAAAAVQRELAETARWAALEQERANELAKARDALEAKNSALHAAQEALQAAYADLQREAAARERLENELRMAQKLEAIGQLSAGIAHEINTPMQYIGDNLSFLSSCFDDFKEYATELDRALAAAEARGSGEIALLREQLSDLASRLELEDLARSVPKGLSAARTGVEHVSRIVRAMRSFAGLDPAEKSPSDINQALQDTLVVARGEYKHFAAVETDLQELPEVYCFIGKLKQVFLNLIVNAAHAIADTGRSELGTIRVSSRYHEGMVEVRVSDDGAGIPDEIRHRIFDQFFTTKSPGRGTGQGLSIARGIAVDAHGGSISVESELGKGSTFCVRLPLGRPRD